MADGNVNINIKVNGGDKAAQEIRKPLSAAEEKTGAVRRAFNGLEAAVKKIGPSVSVVTRSMAILHLATGFIGQVIGVIGAVVGKLKEWASAADKSRQAQEQLADAARKTKLDESIKAAEEAQKNLNAALSETVAKERELDAIASARTNQVRGLEDANLNLQEQQALAAISPDDPDAGAKRAIVGARFGKQRNSLSATRAREDSMIATDKLRRQMGQMTGQAENLESQANGALAANVEAARSRLGDLQYESRNATSTSFWTGRQTADKTVRAAAAEKIPEAMAQLKDAIEKEAAARKEAGDLRGQADLIGERINATFGQGRVAAINAQAGDIAADSSIAAANSQIAARKAADAKAAAEKKAAADAKAKKEADDAATLARAEDLLSSASGSMLSAQAGIQVNNSQMTENARTILGGGGNSAAVQAANNALAAQNAALRDAMDGFRKQVEDATRVINRLSKQSRSARGVDETEGA